MDNIFFYILTCHQVHHGLYRKLKYYFNWRDTIIYNYIFLWKGFMRHNHTFVVTITNYLYVDTEVSLCLRWRLLQIRMLEVVKGVFMRKITIGLTINIQLWLVTSASINKELKGAWSPFGTRFGDKSTVIKEEEVWIPMH